jgi:hypothetical protein
MLINVNITDRQADKRFGTSQQESMTFGTCINYHLKNY